MKIIKYKKKANNKYQLLLEDGSTLDTYDDVIIKNNLLYKKDINNNLIEKIKDESDYQKLYNSCVKYISLRLRSVKEINIYLDKKNTSPEIKQVIINNLLERNILNDDLFTECFIKDKLKLTNWGKFKIKNNLKELGIDNITIEKHNHLFDYNLQKEKIKKIIDKSIKANHKENPNLKNKIYTNLMNLGYEREMILEQLNNKF